MSKVKHYKLPKPPPDPEVVDAEQFAMTLPVEKYADMERDVVWGYLMAEETEDIHIKNDLFTLDITDMNQACDAHIEFTVKGTKADIDDFGDWDDIDPQHAPKWGCGCKSFTIWLVEDATLEKYGITKEEYYIIGQVLEKYLYIGCCDFCR